MNTWMKRFPHPSRWVLLMSCLAISAVLIAIFVSVRTRAQTQDGQENRKKPVSGSVVQPSTIQQLQLAPLPAGIEPGCTEGIVDGGFETGGIPNTIWNPGDFNQFRHSTL